jgi:proteic killer suppression protein
VIQGFSDKASEDIRNGKASRAARNRLPTALWRTAARKFDQLHRVLDLEELRVPPGNHLEALRGDRQGQHAIRINEQYRICFVWGPDGPDQVEVVDYH